MRQVLIVSLFAAIITSTAVLDSAAAQTANTAPRAQSRSKGLVNRILFNGVNLTAKEKKAIHKWRVSERRRLRAAHKKPETTQQLTALRTARAKHDTATVARLTALFRAKERARVNREVTKLRTYLTPMQRVRFDKNVHRYKLLQTRADARLPTWKKRIMARKP
jgi:hypothetical protein